MLTRGTPQQTSSPVISNTATVTLVTLKFARAPRQAGPSCSTAAMRGRTPVPDQLAGSNNVSSSRSLATVLNASGMRDGLKDLDIQCLRR